MTFIPLLQSTLHMYGNNSATRDPTFEWDCSVFHYMNLDT